jgi:diguanylate cyclase (GGDEF)-like protein
MLKQVVIRLWNQAWSTVLSEIRANESGALFRARGHTMRLTARRSGIIVSRVRLLAATFAVLTPLWGLVDFWTLAAERRLEVASVMALTSVAFAAILVLAQRMHTLRDAYRALLLLYAVPCALFVYSYLNAVHLDTDGVLDGFAAGYAYLPFVLLGGIALFPLTLVESVLLASLVVLVQVAAYLPSLPTMPWPVLFGQLAVLGLIGAVSVLAALSQLALLFVMVRDGLNDNLTGCYSRRAGEVLLELQYTLCSRSNANLSVAIVAPDGLQRMNEAFGYTAGDAALREVTQRLHDSMRAGDILVRWTGNEFLAVMPLATAEQASGAVQRLLSGGLGQWPDGKPVTASIGISDRLRDETKDWWMLVDAAADRANSARAAGGNRSV